MAKFKIGDRVKQHNHTRPGKVTKIIPNPRRSDDAVYQVEFAPDNWTKSPGRTDRFYQNELELVESIRTPEQERVSKLIQLANTKEQLDALSSDCRGAFGDTMYLADRMKELGLLKSANPLSNNESLIEGLKSALDENYCDHIFDAELAVKKATDAILNTGDYGEVDELRDRLHALKTIVNGCIERVEARFEKG